MRSINIDEAKKNDESKKNDQRMIQNSFIFLERIGPGQERRWWSQGINDWSDFLKAERIAGLNPQRKAYYHRRIQEAQQALLQEQPAYFVGKLPAKEMWRLYPFFRDECCFLDVETDSQGKIMLVGVSNYYNTTHFVQGFNLDKAALERELAKYKLLITFNGSSFDLPKLKAQFTIIPRIPHIDLKPLCVALGLKGGLKAVEELLDLRRPNHLQGHPVELWKAFHASGDREYLDLLIDYNAEDVENLKAVMEQVYRRKKAQYSYLRKTE